MSETATANTPLTPPTLAYEVPREALGRRAVANSLWTVGSYAIFNVVRLVGSLVITHLLAQQWIGVMAIVTTVLIGIRLFSDVGIGPAVISNPRGNQEPFLRTAYAMQIMRGLMIWIVACAAAYPVAWYYSSAKSPVYSILAVLLPVAGFQAVIEGFRSTAVFRLQRQLQLRKTAILEVIEICATTTIMIAWASIHPTVWALVIPSLLGTTISTSISHLLLRDRVDRPQWHADCAKELMRIGRWIFLSTALTFLATQFAPLIFGSLVDPNMLAIYWIALNLATMPFNAISKLGSTVLFPTFSRVVADERRFADIYGRARSILLLGGGTFICGMIAASPFAIRMLYRADYDGAGWMLQLLALSIWFQIVDTTNVAGLLARQHAGWMVTGNLVKVVFMFTLVPLVFHHAGRDSHAYGFGAALVALGFADALRAGVGITGLVRNGLPWRCLRADLLVPPAVIVVGTLALLVTSHWAPSIEALFPVGKMGRRLSNLVLCTIAGMQVLAVFLPMTYILWQRTRRVQPVT